MISSLDSRYASQLTPIKDFLGDEAFIYYMSIWSIAYAESTNKDCFIPLYENRSELYERVRRFEVETKHQMTALIKVLEQDYPNVRFHQYLTSEDMFHNSRTLQMNLIITRIYDEVRNVETQIQRLTSNIKFPILEHTHGQPATPVDLAPFLRAKMRDSYLARPNYRLGGSNGQLSIWKKVAEASNMNFDAVKLGQKVLKRTMEKVVDDRSFEDVEICVPSDRVGLLQVGPHNDHTFLSAMSLSLKLRALARTFWSHCQRKLLIIHTTSTQTGSSAMPHKVNPIACENAIGSFTIAYNTFQTALEANCETPGLRDLSNSVINRQVLDGFAYLFLGIKNMVRFMETSEYSHDQCLRELKENPECLGEYLRYYIMVNEKRDPYFEIKNNPPRDFDETLKRMPGWDFRWPM
jgi:adenylosuccinate lyase